MKTLGTLTPLALSLVLGLAPVAGSAQVVLYQHCSFDGYYVEVDTGYWDLYDLQSGGVLNDDISAIGVDPGYATTIFEHAGFQGRSLTISGDVACLVDWNFNDVLSSIVVAPR